MEAQEYKNEDIKEISNDDEEKLIMKTIEKIQNPEKQAKLLYLNKIADEREKIAENADKAQKDLIKKYNIQYSDINNKINDIVFGNNNNLDLTDEEKKLYNIDSSDSNTNEIKNYWKTVLENADYFMFDDEDKKVLNYLNKILYEDTENGFKVSFIFDQNEYFEPNILSKEYIYNDKNEISSIKATEINWKKEEFKNKKNIKQDNNKKDKKHKKDNKNKNNDGNVDSLFSIFKSIDNIIKKEKEEEKKGKINEELENELAIIDEEIDFFKNDLFKNQLEYYLNIMEIQEEDFDDEEYGEEDDYENDYYSNIHSNNNNNNYRGRGYGRGQRRGRYNNYNNYNDYDNYNDYNDYNDYDNYDDYGYRNNNYYGNRGNNYYNNYGGGRGYGRGGRGGRGRYNYYQRDYY